MRYIFFYSFAKDVAENRRKNGAATYRQILECLHHEKDLVIIIFPLIRKHDKIIAYLITFIFYQRALSKMITV